MNRLLTILYTIGLVLFLGSILTFSLVSTLAGRASLENLAFGRDIITTGIRALTLPGMWLMALAGLLKGFRLHGLWHRRFQLNLGAMALIILITYALVVPAATLATATAHLSQAAGHLLPGFPRAYLRESIFGAVNILLALVGLVVNIPPVGGAKRR